MNPVLWIAIWRFLPARHFFYEIETDLDLSNPSHSPEETRTPRHQSTISTTNKISTSLSCSPFRLVKNRLDTGIFIRPPLVLVGKRIQSRLSQRESEESTEHQQKLRTHSVSYSSRNLVPILLIPSWLALWHQARANFLRDGLQKQLPKRKPKQRLG